jgi:type IV pilus assembly protein PilY1
LRFEHIDIPKGATIKNARIEFTSAAAVDGSATFTINAENIGDALAFDDTDDHNISSRTTFGASRNVSWSVNSWNSGMTYPTDELSTLVQSVVNHNNWCGGNSLAFIIQGDSSTLHRVFSYDGDPSSAPKLNIEFDPPESGTGCMNQSYFGAITNEEDDAEQKTDGQVFITTEGDTLDVGFGESGATDLRTIGLRFRNVPIRPSATIKSAHLIFHAQAGNNDDNAEFTIEGQQSPNSEPFNEDINRDVSDRPKVKVGSSVKSISWPVTKSWEPGKAYRSPDITSLVQEMVQQEGWNAGTNSMTFIVTGESGQRQVYSSEAGTTTAPTLHVQIEGYLGQMDTRAHLKKTVASLTPSAWTPIVDALYESAIYFRGGEVFYGKDRQNKSQNLLSHPSTYTHVTPLAADTPKVQTPNGCNVEVDPFSWKCKGEKITETSSSKPVYTSPIKRANSPCQTNHVVLLTDGVATRNDSVDEVQALIGESCQTIWDGFEEMASSSECDDNRCEKCGISLAKFLHEEDQYDDPDDSSDDLLKNTVTTHTIGFMLKNQHAVEYMTKMAEMGGGNFYPVDDATQLKEAFTSIIVSAMQESTSFAPAGISINRYNRLVHNNEVFFALFKPAMTRSWAGNVKKFKFAQVPVSNPASRWCDRNSTSASGTTVLCLVDQDGKVAVENQFISPSARSFWSPQVDGPDVITGGAGGLLSTNTNRKVLTYVGSGPDYPATLRDISTLDTGELESAGMTGVDKEDNRLTADLLRNWVLGQKTNGEARDWLMAEPIHSSPQAISYAPVTTNTDGTKNSSVTKIFVGTNDGLVRMFDGETGSEEWAFLPQELFGIQADLMNNTADYAGTEHIYGMDTTPAFWINDKDGIIDPADGDFVRMFLGQRRGGSNYYALDVTGSSRDSQGSPPKLMWVIKGGSDSYFQRLGQTWSFASPVKVDPSYCSAIDKDLLESDYSCIVLLFGGGYDVSQDDDNNFGNSGIGNAIYMVHAKTGERLWWASSYATGGGNLMLGEMNYSIPSNITVLDTNGDRWIDRLYVGDVAGQLWRIELLGKDEDGTDLTLGDRLAVVSAVDTSGVVAADSGRNAKRRFFNSPDWTKTDIGELVTIASGTRPDPLGTGVQDRFYVFIDNGQIIKDKDKEGKLKLKLELTTISENKMVNVEQLETQSVVDANDVHGWFRELPGEGEKALGSPLVTKLGDKNLVLFTTYTPSPPSGVCDFQEGISRLYALNLLTGGPAFNTNKSDNNCTGDTCPKDFDTDDDGDDMSDSSIVIREGISPDISLLFTDKEISALVGTERMTIDDDRGLQRTFWLQVDDVD